ncbi:MAG TPA: helix-turn-helix transcriptional regulator [Thermoanaerobaculia bacterium]|jgi:transcriptional regulator with XRE-family HTH domain
MTIVELGKQLGRIIRQAREHHELSQEELARRCGMSRRHLIEIEQGRNFSVAVLAAIARELEEIGPAVADFLSSGRSENERQQ